ncbi:MAG: MBL fold metallo-hydrolase, partial [Chloroflexaceae bacterium]|nr:MBL fold metallo-hydrolase [Chloroflexaceae bacterium]
MMGEQFIVRFWGTRGSYPVPGPHTLRYGGNTTCVELQIGQHTLIIDAGTGIINLGYDLLRRSKENGGIPISATILLTHMHHDHTQGFPFFLPAYQGTSTLHILGPRTFDEELEDTLNHAVLPP